jgi:hypothetical protein
MTDRTHRGMLLFLLTTGLAGCDGAHGLAPSAPRTFNPDAPIFSVVDVTVSGVVYEVTPTGEMPIEGASVSNGEGQFRMVPQLTDANGFFSFRSVWVCPCAGSLVIPPGTTFLVIGKDGYKDPPGLSESVFRPHAPGYRDVMIEGDTYVRIQLVRR